MIDQKPRRIQRNRAKGWEMSENTVYVGRPTKWGNPFVPGKENPFLPGLIVEDLRHAFCLYRAHAPLSERLVAAARAELRGKNLACWCPVHAYRDDGVCHADVLLEIANA
jgi:hypothetical protein